MESNIFLSSIKVYIIFWEGYKILQNLYQLFVPCTASQMIGGDFANFVAFLEYMNFKISDYSIV